MTRLPETDKENIVELIETYRKLHGKIAEIEEGIAAVEKEMKVLHSKKDSVIAQIQANRDHEKNILAGLSEKYGDGKLSIEEMAWVLKETTENEN